MLRLATERRAKFLLTSTSEVYGDPLVHPQTEDYWGNVNPIGLRACYDEAKRFAEAATMESDPQARRGRSHRPDLQHVRPPQPARRRPGRAELHHPGAARRADDHLRRRRQTRSFQYVSDLVDGLIRAMFTAETKAEVFNLGNPGEFTILEFAQQVHRGHRQPFRPGLPAAPLRGRPRPPPPGHHPGEIAPRLGAPASPSGKV